MERCAVHGTLDPGRALNIITGNKVHIHIVDRGIDVRVLGVFFMIFFREGCSNTPGKGKPLIFEFFPGQGRVKEHEHVKVAVTSHPRVPGNRPHDHPLGLSTLADELKHTLGNTAHMVLLCLRGPE